MSLEIFNQFNKRTKKINGALSKYENDKIVNQLADKNINSENYNKNIKSIFKNLNRSEQKHFLKKSVEFFKIGEQIDEDLLIYLKEKNKKVEEKALSLNKIPLLNLIASRELTEKRKKVINAIDNLILFDFVENSTDISLYFGYGMEILRLSTEIEYLIILKMKKT